MGVLWKGGKELGMWAEVTRQSRFWRGEQKVAVKMYLSPPRPTNYVVKSQKTTEDRGQIKAGTVDLSGWVFNLI